MKKFEYRREFQLNMEKLNELGKQGWELVAIVNTVDFYLKREI